MGTSSVNHRDRNLAGQDAVDHRHHAARDAADCDQPEGGTSSAARGPVVDAIAPMAGERIPGGRCRYTVERAPRDRRHEGRLFRAGVDADAAEPWQPISVRGRPRSSRRSRAAWSTHPRLRGEAGQQALRMAGGRRAFGIGQGLSAALPISRRIPMRTRPDSSGPRCSTSARSMRSSSQRNCGRWSMAQASSPRCRPPRTSPPRDAGDARRARSHMAGVARQHGVRRRRRGPARQSSWQRNRMEYAFALKAATRLDARRIHRRPSGLGGLHRDALSHGTDRTLQTFAVESRTRRRFAIPACRPIATGSSKTEASISPARRRASPNCCA